MTELPAEGWYDDPLGTPAKRYWDGAQWTGHIFSPPPAGAVLAPPGQAPSPEPARAAQSTAGPEPSTSNQRTRTSRGHVILTPVVERMAAIESKLGVEFDAVLAVFDESDGEVVVLGDVLSTGRPVQHDLEIIATAMNAEGQVLGKDNTFVDAEEMVWRSPFRLEISQGQAPARIRLIAKKF